MTRTVWITVGIVGLIVILTAGTFTTVRLLNASEQGVPAGAQVFEDVYDDGSGNPVTVKTIILPAPELPTDEEEGVGGVFLRQEDNSYFVGTGSTSVNVTITDGVPEVAVDHSGPEIEVVFNRDTVFYEDITEVSFEASESKEQTLQQVVRQVDAPAEVTGGSSITAWGERRGDRVIATTVVIAEVK